MEDYFAAPSCEKTDLAQGGAVKLAIARATNPLMRSVRKIVPGVKKSNGDRVAFIASYGNCEYFSKSVIELVRQLSGRGYEVVLVRASDSVVLAEWPSAHISVQPTIIYRKNTGYDFGSWAVGMQLNRKLLSRPYVLIANDSLVGPFGPMDAVLDSYESTSADVWGVSATTQFTDHLQSFMLGFRRGVLARYPLRRFWKGIRNLPSKDHFVHLYEIGLSKLLVAEMFTTDSFIKIGQVVPNGHNPMVAGWEAVLDSDFPFVKRELLEKEIFGSLRAHIADDVRDRFGEDPLTWFERVEERSNDQAE